METDDSGAFDFAGLPGGSYYISVAPTNGFLELARARQAIVGEGRALEVSIRLERTGAIVGRVADRNGEGLLGVEVVAPRRNDFRGHVTLMALLGSSASTNDLGQFRLFNLSPGEYFVVATPRAHFPRDLGTARRSGFVTTYYPGTRALADARLVVVRAGKDVPRVNFSLASGPLAPVAIDAVDSRGLPLGREASATLNLRSDVYLPSSMRQAGRQDGGRFVLSDVPPGDQLGRLGTEADSGWDCGCARLKCVLLYTSSGLPGSPSSNVSTNSSAETISYVSLARAALS